MAAKLPRPTKLGSRITLSRENDNGRADCNAWLAGFTSSVVTSAIVSAVIAPALWYWFRERLKQSIKHEYDIQLERLRSDLRVDAYREEIRFSKLHERRDVVISGTYALLRKVRNEVKSLLNFPNTGDPVDPTTSEGLTKIGEAIAEFNTYFFPRQIYIPHEIASEITDLRRDYLMTVMTAVEKQKQSKSDVKSRAWLDGIIEAHNIREAEFDAIEVKLRAALGEKRESAETRSCVPWTNQIRQSKTEFSGCWEDTLSVSRGESLKRTIKANQWGRGDSKSLLVSSWRSTAIGG